MNSNSTAAGFDSLPQLIRAQRPPRLPGLIVASGRARPTTVIYLGSPTVIELGFL
ncbi:MAG: hypothetical protein QM392_05105 [Bacillota bacterium]|jgi:hypothetical protein|nr:hypothetical protein [Bacillota bacterium]